MTGKGLDLTLMVFLKEFFVTLLSRQQNYIHNYTVCKYLTYLLFLIFGYDSKISL